MITKGSVPIAFNPLSANPTKWSITLKQFVGNSQRIVWECLITLWGWCLKWLVVIFDFSFPWFLNADYLSCSWKETANFYIWTKTGGMMIQVFKLKSRYYLLQSWNVCIEFLPWYEGHTKRLKILWCSCYGYDYFAHQYDFFWWSLFLKSATHFILNT